MSASAAASQEIPLPVGPLDITLFWQNGHPKEQPSKNTVPEPIESFSARGPEIGGSSPWWIQIAEASGWAGALQKPSSVLSEPLAKRLVVHCRGQLVHFMLQKYNFFLHFNK